MLKIIDTLEEIDEFLSILDRRGAVDEGKYLNTVKEILDDIKENKDNALLKYTVKFDDPNATIESLVVTKQELEAAYNSLDNKMKGILIKSKDRIYNYHLHQLRETWIREDNRGEVLGQKITPLNRVGVYVPGGKASYPSSVLMNVVPALVANVNEIIMVTPAIKGYVNPLVLAAAYICNVTKVIKIGGAQAVGALTYGTNIVPKVDKIVGPGNIYVALAKKSVFGTVGIDSIAGPSEILVISDDKANPTYVALDLLGQAEHDELASSVLITTSKSFAKEVASEINRLYNISIRKDILDKSIINYSRAIVVKDLEQAFNLANEIAPEHLEVVLDNAQSYLNKIKNAGAIFLGHYTPEALGDYMAGPNHVLPTVKTSRFFSPLGVDDFIKKSSIIGFTKEAMSKLAEDVASFADEEGLQMHALSVLERLK